MNEQKTNKMASTPMKKLFWKMPIAEVLTAIISLFILKKSYKEKIYKINVVE